MDQPLAQSADRIAALTPELLAQVRDAVAVYSGIYLDAVGQRLLEQSVLRRVQACNMDTINYARRIKFDQSELQRLSELLTNHETFFFRNQPQVRALREVVLPELHRHKPAGAPIRIWSAGCATGEEAYSLAITALQTLEHTGRPVQVWATDLSTDALHAAQIGVYSGRALTNVDPATLAAYFQPHADGYAVQQRVRNLVTFEQLNLRAPFPPNAVGIDLVFCQNVIIYFQRETVQALMHQFYQALAPGGVLCLGFSETLWNVFDAFHAREIGGAYVYYKEAFSRLAARHRGSARQPTAPLALAAQPAVRAGNRQEQAAQPSATNNDCSTSNGEALQKAQFHADSGQFVQALAEAQHALALEPLNSDAMVLLGVLHSRMGSWHQAVEHLERARYLQAGNPLISYYLAEAYRQRGNLRYALREYRNTIHKLEPYPPDSVIDGVAIRWLRDICQRQLDQHVQQIGE